MTSMSSDMKRKYQIIAAIACNNQPSLNDIVKETDIPESTVKRQISQIKSDLNMDIKFIPNTETVGRSGHYHISSWGVINRDEFLLQHGTENNAKKVQTS